MESMIGLRRGSAHTVTIHIGFFNQTVGSIIIQDVTIIWASVTSLILALSGTTAAVVVILIFFWRRRLRAKIKGHNHQNHHEMVTLKEETGLNALLKV